MNLRPHIAPGIACIISVALCLLYAVTRSQLPDWWRSHGGGVPYVLFWILLVLTFVPRRSAVVPVCVVCVLATCALEVFQLWQGSPWLQEFRQTTFGAALLGSGFDLADIPPYFIGGVCGWIAGILLFRKVPD